MEPLRVLELYSGIGGMHQALRGGSALSASPLIPALALVRARAPGRGGAARLWGGDRGRRGGLGCPGNRRAGLLLPPLWAEAPGVPPPAVPRARGSPLEDSVCESRSARRGYKMGGASPLPGAGPRSLSAGRPEAWRLSPSLWGTSGGRGGRSASLGR